MNQADSLPRHDRRWIVVLAVVSVAAYTGAVSSVPIETWRRLPSPPALHDATVAVGITALVLTPTSAFLDAVITSVAHSAIDQPNAGVLSYIDGLRTTLLTIVTLIFVEAIAVVDTNPASVRTDAAAIILIAGSALATPGSRTPDSTPRRRFTGALRRLVGWCGVVGWPAYHFETQRIPSVIASVLYLAAVVTWTAVTFRDPHSRRPVTP